MAIQKDTDSAFIKGNFTSSQVPKPNIVLAVDDIIVPLSIDKVIFTVTGKKATLPHPVIEGGSWANGKEITVANATGIACTVDTVTDVNIDGGTDAIVIASGASATFICTSKGDYTSDPIVPAEWTTTR